MLRPRLIVPLVVAALVGAAVPAAIEAHLFSSTGTISVTAGVPKELAFKVSPTKITSATAVFNVTNKGKQPHSFKLCTSPSTTDKANSCTGVATKMLAPGATVTLKVTLKASGTYEYLSGTASQAASGMKGLVTVALSSGPIATQPVSTTSTPSTTTSSPPKSGSGGGGSGGVVNGQATDPSCAAGTTIAVGPGAGDQDDDNEGGFPSDGDGCL